MEDNNISLFPINSKNIFKAFPIGRLCISKKASAIFAPNEVGIVLEHYSLNNRPGIGIYFLNQSSWDGFSEKDLEIFIENSNFIYLPLKNFTFTNVIQLYQNLDKFKNSYTSFNNDNVLSIVKKKECDYLATKIANKINNKNNPKNNKI